MLTGDGYATARLPEGEHYRTSGALRMARSPERNAMGELLTTFPWRVYCTWTFSERTGEDGALREIRRWLHVLEFAFGRDVGWVVGLEQEQGAEWPHAHGLVCGERTTAAVTLYRGKKHERTVPLIEPYWRAWTDRHGRGDFRVVVGEGRAASFYCTKYATKRGTLHFSANLEKFRGTAPVLERFTLFPELPL